MCGMTCLKMLYTQQYDDLYELYLDSGRAKSEALVNIYSLFEKNIKSFIIHSKIFPRF